MPNMTKTIRLENIPKGWYLSWEMATLAANKISVVLKDSARTYVNNSAQGLPRKILAEGYEQVSGDNLAISITIENAAKLDTYVAPFAVPAPDGTLVIRGYNVYVEDANDGDWNDLIVSLIASRGGA